MILIQVCEYLWPIRVVKQVTINIVQSQFQFKTRAPLCAKVWSEMCPCTLQSALSLKEISFLLGWPLLEKCTPRILILDIAQIYFLLLDRSKDFIALLLSYHTNLYLNCELNAHGCAVIFTKMGQKQRFFGFFEGIKI